MKQRIKNITKKVIRKSLNVSGIGSWYMRDLQKGQPGTGTRVVDVLFVNGCDPCVPHPPRYRVSHQREQLEAFNITTNEVFYTQVSELDVKYANAFVIFRCPYTEAVGKLIETAHKLNKPVFFDIDDLVVDTKYTDLIPYVQGLKGDELALYNDGVCRMGKTLSMCDGAITTTGALANELAKYVPQGSFINRNVASEEMYKYSLEAIEFQRRNEVEDVCIDELLHTVVPKRMEDEVRIGYFSGSITHNADVDLIKPALIRVLQENPNVRLYLVGELDIPEEFEKVQSQIMLFPFMDWKKLPRLISMVDINLAPLEDTIFNRAKSENKWVEAALVNVVTMASALGAFEESIEDGKTGYLCDENEWYQVLTSLVHDKEKCKLVASNANEFVIKNYITTSSGKGLADFIRNKLQKTVAIVLPSTEISGGIMVALRHGKFLQEAGYNVTIWADKPSLGWIEYENATFPVVAWNCDINAAFYKKAIATMWTTTEFLRHGRLEEKYYFVQNYETDFYEHGIILRGWANSTYSLEKDIHYVTMSRWCQKWLKEDFEREAEYVPNGISLDAFPYRERDFSGKIRILIEGDSEVSYKGVDESFRIVEKLDAEKFEIWYMSYNGKKKDWYRVDRFLHRVPYAEVGGVYKECDILLKSSSLESFSYPPLEMMATGGFVVVVPNGGNTEYLKDNENCLFYPQGDVDAAVASILKIVDSLELRNKLQQNYEQTLTERDWTKIKDKVLEIYNA